jgi:NAD(P)-dependent dehydrogenase (short-subunit alcohol dehydrogenase family)
MGQEYYRDKVVLVTGGTSGMGKVTAISFAEQGAIVCISGTRSKEEGDSIAKSIGKDVFYFQCNVASSNDVRTMIAGIEEKFGRLDCAFNNAGISPEKKLPLAESSEEDWVSVINTNLNGIYYCMKYELQLMLKNGKGSIVNNSSVAAKGAWPKRASYVASKLGVIGLTKSASNDYAELGIRINAIAPGAVSGGMNTPEKLAADQEGTKIKLSHLAMKRFVDPKEVADAVLFLSSDKASAITGITLDVDAGYI